MAVSIGDAVLKVGVDKKDFDRKMTGIGASIKKHQRAIGLGMATMGAAILAAGALSVKTFAAMGDEVQKMALRTGFSTEALSELRHAAELSGASLAGLEKASRTLAGAILDAGYGLETYVRSFDKIGLSYEKLKDLSPEEQFMAVMEALAGVTDESERAAIATDLFGRAGTQLLPMLVDGAEGLKDMRQEAHDLGIVFDQEAANKAAEFQDALTRLKGSMSGVMIEIGSFIVDYIKPLVDRITEAIKTYTKWADEHKTLDRAIKGTVLALGSLLLVMGTIIVLRIPAMITAFIAFGKILLVTIIPAVWATVTALWAWITAQLALMAATGILIPVVIAAVAGIALMATGIALLVRNQREMYDSTKAVTQATLEGTKGTELYGDTAAGAYNRVSGAVDKLVKKIRRLNKAQREGLKVIGQIFPKGMTMTELQAIYSQVLKPLGFQEGGIVTQPTLAMIGERGPEAVIPLDRGIAVPPMIRQPVGIMERLVNIYVELDGRVIARAVGQPLVDEIRLRTGVRI